MPKHPYERCQIMALEFDVALAWTLIEADGREPNGLVNVQEQGLQMFGPRDPVTWQRTDNSISIFHYADPERAMQDDVDYTVPVILANLDDLGTPIIDGTRRVFKAYMQGVEEMQAHLLSPAETYCIITEHWGLYHTDGTRKNHERKAEIARVKKVLKKLGAA